MTSLDRSLHYHLLSAYSSARRQLLWSCLDILLNGFWAFVNDVFTGAHRQTWIVRFLCRPVPNLFQNYWNCTFKGRGRKWKSSFRILNVFRGNFLAVGAVNVQDMIRLCVLRGSLSVVLMLNHKLIYASQTLSSAYHLKHYSLLLIIYLL